MKSQGWIAICGAVLSFAFAIVSLYFALEIRFGTQLLGSSTFSVDQILAALTLMVGLVGLVVAVTAIAIAIVAVFGYGEIRQLASRRTDELLRKVIYSLRKRGDISSIEARNLLQAMNEEELAENEPKTVDATSNGEEKEKQSPGDAEDDIKKYPPSK
jgi:ABC-type multidrug transport system fused ATPase/permease subunit